MRATFTHYRPYIRLMAKAYAVIDPEVDLFISAAMRLLDELLCLRAGACVAVVKTRTLVAAPP
jgi:hypothetical protein